MGGLRGAKGTTFEGGIRVPLIIRWPDKIAAGQVCHQPCLTFDLTRSFLKLAGASVPGELDGDDIIGHVISGKPDYLRTLFWRGKRGDKTWSAVRHGDAKYVRKVEGDRTEEWTFDLGDSDESVELESSETTSQLQKLLAEWENDVKPAR